MTGKNMQRVVILCATILLIVIYMLFGTELSKIAFEIKLPAFVVYGVLIGMIVKRVGKQ